MIVALQVTPMTPELIRSLWNLIEQLPSDILITHDKNEFIDLLIGRLQSTHNLDRAQSEAARDYLKSKILLICELNERHQYSPYSSLSA
ncbi:MAG: hypothetical protein AAGB01_06040 [Cyanobacteria bacterium P01_F01_bin.42]